jgi:hypothetical protein
VQVFQDDLEAAQYIDLEDETLLEGMAYLVEQGLLTENRKTEILSISSE